MIPTNSTDIVNTAIEDISGNQDITDTQEAILNSEWNRITSDLKFDDENSYTFYLETSIGLCRYENISCIAGKEKTGKSLLAGYYAARALLNAKRVLYIDSEQSNEDCLSHYKSIIHNSGKEYEKNLVYITPLPDLQERRLQIELAAKKYSLENFDIIIVDQAGDWITDRNDNSKALEFVTYLSNLVKKHKFHLLLVYHKNKSNDETIGHLGAEINKKIENLFNTTLEGSVINISNTLNRKKKIPDFAIRVNFRNDGIAEFRQEKTTDQLLKKKRPNGKNEISNLSTDDCIDLVNRIFDKDPVIESDSLFRTRLKNLGYSNSNTQTSLMMELEKKNLILTDGNKPKKFKKSDAILPKI